MCNAGNAKFMPQIIWLDIYREFDRVLKRCKWCLRHREKDSNKSRLFSIDEQLKISELNFSVDGFIDINEVPSAFDVGLSTSKLDSQRMECKPFIFLPFAVFKFVTSSSSLPFSRRCVENSIWIFFEPLSGWFIEFHAFPSCCLAQCMSSWSLDPLKPTSEQEDKDVEQRINHERHFKNCRPFERRICVPVTFVEPEKSPSDFKSDPCRFFFTTYTKAEYNRWALKKISYP